MYNITGDFLVDNIKLFWKNQITKKKCILWACTIKCSFQV